MKSIMKECRFLGEPFTVFTLLYGFLFFKGLKKKKNKNIHHKKIHCYIQFQYYDFDLLLLEFIFFLVYL